MKEECKRAITWILLMCALLPDTADKDHLLDMVCDEYGTEFVAGCLMEMVIE